MSLVINNNMSSLIAQRNLSFNTKELQASFERLSSGYKINSASDNAAGLSISESLRSQIRGNEQGIQNIQDGVSMMQIAESALSTVSDHIQRIRELAVQAVNGTNGATEKEAVLSEIEQRLADIDRISKTTTYTDFSLLDGSNSALRLQIGSGTDVSTNTINISEALQDVRTTSLGIDFDSDTVSGETWSSDNIRSYIEQLDTALSSMLNVRATVGAFQNRLESTLENLTTMNENLRASDSRIRDVDIAQETSNMTKYQILQQASAAILQQANTIPQMALSLL
ncbi:MAG: flagellin [Candidatus Gastranaerophilales bacterium]|nr:flagellin [Candidatus Gastranaerophilales bacterium]